MTSETVQPGDELEPSQSTPVAGGERAVSGIPGVGQRRRRKGKAAVLWVVAVAILAAIGAAIGISLFANRLLADHKQKAEEARAARLKAASTTEGGARDFDGEKKQIKKREEQEAALSPASMPAALPAPSGAVGQSAAQPIAVKPVNVPGVAGGPSGAVGPAGQASPAQQQGGDAGWYSGVLLKSSEGTQRPDATAQAVTSLIKKVTDTPSGGSIGGSNSRNPLDEQLAPSATARAAVAKASFLPDLSYLLERGSLIPCVGPKIVTTYAGMLSCTLMQDVYSADGKTLLLRKGATAHAEQRTALMQGQARIFALFTEIDDGPVTVALDSPATDPLGGSGIEAYTDTHFWTRFGGAIMVSVIGDLGQGVANLGTRNNGGTTISLSNTTSAAQQLAAETLRNTINVPPTGYANQGAVIYIYVARHIDFRSVYELAKG